MGRLPHFRAPRKRFSPSRPSSMQRRIWISMMRKWPRSRPSQHRNPPVSSIVQSRKIVLPRGRPDRYPWRDQRRGGGAPGSLSVNSRSPLRPRSRNQRGLNRSMGANHTKKPWDTDNYRSLRGRFLALSRAKIPQCRSPCSYELTDFSSVVCPISVQNGVSLIGYLACSNSANAVGKCYSHDEGFWREAFKRHRGGKFNIGVFHAKHAIVSPIIPCEITIHSAVRHVTHMYYRRCVLSAARNCRIPVSSFTFPMTWPR